jgi:hypothetical protein
VRPVVGPGQLQLRKDDWRTAKGIPQGPSGGGVGTQIYIFLKEKHLCENKGKT